MRTKTETEGKIDKINEEKTKKRKRKKIFIIKKQSGPNVQTWLLKVCLES